MGALALPTLWIPEDDLMLKNAIESGASLESLAKGAVEFSRRFTFKELQDRWLALLYDPIISTRAAEQMVELERSATNLASKSNRADSSKGASSKGARNTHGKRKAESVRRCYYAMKKKVFNEHHNQGDMAFLIGTGDNCFMDGVEAPVADNMLGDPMVGHFGLGDYEHVDFDELRNEFPQIIRDGAPSCGASEFPIEKHNNTFEDHVEHNTMLPHNVSSKEHPSHSMYEGSSIQVNTDCNRKDIMCSGFEGNTAFNPSIPECETQFHLLYTSPPPALPDWKTIDGMPVPEIPDDINIEGNNVHTGDPFVNNDAGGTSEYGVMHTDPALTNQMPGDDLENPRACTGGIYPDMPYAFTREEEMNIFDEGRSVNNGIQYIDMFELLLSESSDVNDDDRLPNVNETNETSATDLYIDIPSNAGPFEKNDVDSHMGESNFQNCSDTQMPMSTAYVNSEFPEYRDGVICCTLNTEDPEIPCNDHIVFPSKPRSASANRRTQSEANNSSLHGKDKTGAQPSGKGLSTMKREQKRFGESRQASLTRGPDVGLNRAIHEPGVKFDTSRPETFNGPRSSSGGPGAPCQSSQGVKKEPLELPLTRQPGCIVAEKSTHISDVDHIQTAVGGTSQDGQTSLALKNQEPLALGSADGMGVEPGIDPLLSDPEEQFSESDADIPYFSDVEAMILDMDLGPEDQDFFCSREVAKYQHEDVRRAIIRLEQNARSYMQRAMESHGALAVLCGRHSRHYIKKPEVFLGRATDDVMVDIDLGREGRANKISRRQAIIKMDKDGTFNLKNTGKCSIYVNSKEVFPRQSLGLLSNCLIEIRGMPFIFDTQEKLVKKYLDNAARKLEDKKVNI